MVKCIDNNARKIDGRNSYYLSLPSHILLWNSMKWEQLCGNLEYHLNSYRPQLFQFNFVYILQNIQTICFNNNLNIRLQLCLERQPLRHKLRQKITRKKTAVLKRLNYYKKKDNFKMSVFNIKFMIIILNWLHEKRYIFQKGLILRLRLSLICGLDFHKTF